MQRKNTEEGKMNIILATGICLVLVAVLIFISINKKTSNTNMPLNNNNANNVPVSPNNTAEVVKMGDTVSVNYTGWLEDSKVAFDSNVDPKFKHVEPFVFTLGAGQVISGWDKGIVGMKVGERKVLTIPPADAYGANGISGVIPPNSTLVFAVELLAIKK